MSLKYAFPLLLSLGLVGWVAGCQTETATPPSPKTGEQKDDHGHDHGPAEAGHDHAHDHAHLHGPHDGHIVEIGNEEYHAEWTHDDKGTVTVYLLDAELKNEVPIPAEEITIETKVAETATTFALPAVREADKTTSAKFETVDMKLLGVLESLSKGVTANLKLDINGKPYEAAITHDDHGHKH